MTGTFQSLAATRVFAREQWCKDTHVTSMRILLGSAVALLHAHALLQALFTRGTCMPMIPVSSAGLAGTSRTHLFYAVANYTPVSAQTTGGCHGCADTPLL